MSPECVCGHSLEDHATREACWHSDDAGVTFCACEKYVASSLKSAAEKATPAAPRTDEEVAERLTLLGRFEKVNGVLEVHVEQTVLRDAIAAALRAARESAFSDGYSQGRREMAGRAERAFVRYLKDNDEWDGDSWKNVEFFMERYRLLAPTANAGEGE